MGVSYDGGEEKVQSPSELGKGSSYTCRSKNLTPVIGTISTNGIGRVGCGPGLSCKCGKVQKRTVYGAAREPLALMTKRERTASH